MHWLVRPAIGWGAWFLLHSVAIPVVYALGKKCGMNKANQQSLGSVETIKTAE